MAKTLNILIGGEAGQGLVTVGEILAKSLVRGGYYIVVTQSYMSRVRGGHNTYAIRVSTEEILAPQEPVDLLVALNDETLTLHQKELTPRGRIVADQGCTLAEENCLKVPYGHLAADKFSNIAALGVVCSLLGLDEALVGRTLEDFFGKKKPGLVEENRRILSEAFRWTSTQPPFSRKLPPLSKPPSRVMMQGNEAIALGAISAGLKFFSFYPMTPSTSIGLTLARLAGKMGLVVEQAEDEIAAINMAIGASFAGAPSMVATSGGGFALMVEGVSLAAMTETPIVIVIAQRPGPATGLPTRTEQGDLNFVLHSGHGEFPRAIFAPGTIEECFYLTRQAFSLAEKYQGPAFILTDQFLSDSYRSLKPLEVETLPSIQPPVDAVSSALPYRRFAITDSGVSPRLLPGLSEHLVVAGSDEHTEDGHLTEDLSVRKQMVEKRLKKMDGIRREVIPPQHAGDQNPDLLLVSWGSSKGSCLEAASMMRSSGRRVATLHFSQVWPLVPEQFMGFLQAARKVAGVEGNATGQLASLIRQETGFEFHQRVNRYDGLPITPEYILRELK
ncbi:MAG: 2-oxoacid:acceptor oxidoreductase subunit alpha [Deltaproteobacteria bacterium]|nr:2-oxoacid:acceptor oxidoreductase subunit alpha [Deltaproteobacteria bacterium]